MEGLADGSFSEAGVGPEATGTRRIGVRHSSCAWLRSITANFGGLRLFFYFFGAEAQATGGDQAASENEALARQFERANGPAFGLARGALDVKVSKPVCAESHHSRWLLFLYLARQRN